MCLVKYKAWLLFQKVFSFINQIETKTPKQDHIFVVYSKAAGTAELAEAIAFHVWIIDKMNQKKVKPRNKVLAPISKVTHAKHKRQTLV